MRLLISWLGCTILGLFLCTAIFAQSTAQMHGAVQDSTGAGVPGAEVKATQTDTNTVRTVTSGADGGYVLTNLPLGPYQVEVSKEGFTKYVQSGIVLQVNSDPLIDVALKIGAVTEQVNVEANATLVETRNSGVGSVMETERILELPLNGRQPTDLITLTGGAVAVANTTGRGVAGAPLVSVAGSLTYGVGFSLDGANHFNYASATTNMMPFPDALQEFKVDTSGITAQQGRSASVSAVTKSGSNEFHGDAFEFLRNGDLNARNSLAAVRDNLKRNQFGGVIGGPIKKDRIFFFGGYQGTTTRATSPTTTTIPTAQMMAGDWTTFESPACNGSQKNLTGGVFSGNTINPAKYDPAALYIVDKVIASAPAPNPCGLVNYTTPTSENDYQFVGRVDYQLNDKNTIFARYMAYHTNLLPASQLTSDLLASTTPGALNLTQSGVLGDTWVISATMVNSIRISTTRPAFTNETGDFFDFCQAGIKMYCGYDPGQFVLSIPGSFALRPTLGNNAATVEQNFNLNEDFSWVKGSHQMSFGANPRIDYYRDSDTYFAMGQISGSANVTGVGLGDFLTGNVQTVSQAAPFYMYEKQYWMSLYATDAWKATQRLTVTFGVRWEPWLPSTLLSGQTASFSLSNFYSDVESKTHPGAPPGFTYPGDPGFPNGLKGEYDNWKNFAPKLGVAWDPKGDGRTSIRASWGLAYAAAGPHLRDDQVQNAPFLNLTGSTVLPGQLDNPWSNLPTGSPFPGLVGTFSPYADYMALPYKLPSPYVSTWNFSVQRQLAANWLVAASYIGSETTHIYTEQPVNYAVLVPNVDGTALGTCPAGVTVGCDSTSNTNQRRVLNIADPNAQIGNMVLFSPTGTSSYNGMLLSAQHRLSQDFSLQANWTWSHCISDYDPDPTMQAGGGENTWTNPQDRRFDRGDCNSDRRFVLNLTAVAQVPKFSNRGLSMVASGWQIAPIYQRSSGQPLDIIAGSDRALNGIMDYSKGTNLQRANCVSGVDPYGSSAPNGYYLNTAAFAQPALGTLGTCAFNGLVGPDFWVFNMALSRTFQIRERQRIEIRAEAFNLTNTYRPGSCSVTSNYCSFLAGSLSNVGPTASSGFTQLSGSTFGHILNAMDPRILQFALKYVF